MNRLVRMSKKELCGRASRTTIILEKAVERLALNRTAFVNYNSLGNKDGVGFKPCSDMFIDNFVLHVLVPDYQIADKKYIHVGVINKLLRDMLQQNGLEKCMVQATCFRQLKDTRPSQNDLEKIPFRNLQKESSDTLYFHQEYKITSSNFDFNRVIAFLRTKKYNDCGVFLKDIDVTCDYAGSFNRQEVMESMIYKHGFRMQKSYDDADGTILENTEFVGENYDDTDRTILDNTQFVGENCLTYMESVDGWSTRCKIYNKMVQMLECKAVRQSIGCHWMDWVCQVDTRLANARDEARDRGLPRTEVTFYCNNNIPEDQFMKDSLLRIINYVDKNLVYSTPYEKTWTAYCNSFLHSLVVVDRKRDVALLVYSYNELTKNISGQTIHDWSKREKWSLSNLTLSERLPIDLIEICETVKTLKLVQRKRQKKYVKDVIIELFGGRYFKIHNDDTKQFTTRLVSARGVYCFNEGNGLENTELVNKAGFVDHPNCKPFLANVQANYKSKVDVEFRFVDELNLQNLQVKESTNTSFFLDEEQQNKIEQVRQEIEEELKKKREEMALLEEYNRIYPHMALKDLPKGNYKVMSIRKCKTESRKKIAIY